nr:evolutionarily conserved signaling intermediate in Toll pathway, mitochondrial isoform X5 [Globicephala melas]
MRLLRFREVKAFFQGHAASHQLGWNWIPRLSLSPKGLKILAASLSCCGCPTGKGMSWAQAILLARGLSRGWGGICSTALTGAPFSQMPLSKDSTDATDPTEPHIVGIQSPDQQAALAHHDPARPIFVEGPFSLWLRDKCVYYHILRADLLPPEEREVEEIPEEWNLYYPMQLDLAYGRSSWDDYEFNIDEVEEGPVFAICMAGAHDQATLAKWIQGLQETNPTLARIPVVFRLSASSGELLASSSGLEETPLTPPEGREEEENNQQRQQQSQS